MPIGVRTEMKPDKLISCHNCAGLHTCWPEVLPSKDCGRSEFIACERPEKGLTTDRVIIAGMQHGVSRKNAVKYVSTQLATWLDNQTIVRLDKWRSIE
jgi:hypothetical protein